MENWLRVAESETSNFREFSTSCLAAHFVGPAGQNSRILSLNNFVVCACILDMNMSELNLDFTTCDT